jgi:heme-degrading monooxygenase HmoA
MYCIIYSFKVQKGKEERFIKSWKEVTNAFIEYCGGLGSRLHKKDKFEYIAYAQWPSQLIRDQAELPPEIKNGAHAEMRSCCESTEVLFELTVVSDLLLFADSTEN